MMNTRRNELLTNCEAFPREHIFGSTFCLRSEQNKKSPESVLAMTIWKHKSFNLPSIGDNDNDFLVNLNELKPDPDGA